MGRSRKSKIIITLADNGYIIENNLDVGFSPSFEVIEERESSENPEMESLKDLLNSLNILLSSQGKYDEQQVYVIIRPGSAHKNFTKKDYEVIWGKPKDAVIELYEEEEGDGPESS